MAKCKNSITEISNKLKDLFKTSLPKLPNIPSILLLGAQFRPGLDSKVIASKVIKRLPETGAVTGPMSDGSANVMEGVIAIIVEEIIHAIILESRVDVSIPPGSIQIIANGANAGGPVISYGQNTTPSSGVGTVR